MASLNVFARRIRKLGKNIETNTDKEVRKIAVLAQQVVVTSTPVDTGRARANWIVSLGFPVETTTENTDKTGGPTIAANNSKIAQRNSGQAVYISNNLPYIGRLNEGYSAQAPANFVEKAVQIAIAALGKARVVKR